jgi:hypothetical protein
LRPRLKRSFLGPSPLRIVDALFGRIDIDHSPSDSARQHLPECLGRLEPVPGSNRHPPRRDLLRTKLPETPVAELCDRFREQPAQLLDRLRLRVVLGQILIDEPGERQRARRAVRTPKALQRPLERLTCIPLRRKAAALHPPRVATTDPIAIRPKRAPISRPRRHLQDLTLLHHHDHSLPLTE